MAQVPGATARRGGATSPTWYESNKPINMDVSYGELRLNFFFGRRSKTSDVQVGIGTAGFPALCQAMRQLDRKAYLAATVEDLTADDITTIVEELVQAKVRNALVDAQAVLANAKRLPNARKALAGC